MRRRRGRPGRAGVRAPAIRSVRSSCRSAYRGHEVSGVARRRRADGARPRRGARAHGVPRPRRRGRSGRAAAGGARPPQGSSSRSARTGQRGSTRDPVALDADRPHGGGVQQQVDEVVVEQVDLVDVQDAAVGAGEQARLELHGPGGSAFSRWSEPSTRSSVAPTGSSTSRTGRLRSSASSANGPSGDTAARVAGRHGEPVARDAPRSAAARRRAPRTMVDFAVPFSPRTRTPPISGLIAVSTRARPWVEARGRRGSSEPTTAQKGYCGRHVRLPLVGHVNGGDARPVFGLPGHSSGVLGHRSGPVPDFHRLPRFSPLAFPTVSDGWDAGAPHACAAR